MNRPYIHLHLNRQRTIDVTPGAGWRRAARALLVALVLVVVLPLLWLIGGLVLLGLVGAAAVLLAVGLARAWWLRRQRGQAVQPRP